MMMSCVGFEVYKFSEPPLLAQQFFQSPPFGCLKIFGAPPQYLHPPLVILNELSLTEPNHLRNFRKGISMPFQLDLVFTRMLLIPDFVWQTGMKLRYHGKTASSVFFCHSGETLKIVLPSSFQY